VGEHVAAEAGQVAGVEVLEGLDGGKWAVRIRMMVPLDSRSAARRRSRASGSGRRIPVRRASTAAMTSVAPLG
jgi:hypothetical protein